MYIMRNCLWSVLLPFWHLHSEEKIVSIQLQAPSFHFITLMLTVTLALSTTPLYPMYFFVEFIALV